ncbi:T9SS type A sorting domain-containing protein [Pedobacter sp. BS3]|uniref:T9SS type A sorting domain-containing protein n=1 Tax=Pedobacter sp. BS3 TaxID=2567937 RepID=UPI0011EF43C2|nr:T9SS type A sorting domain-containing protein [Pedobacter sp. BS3]TZF81731.1 T9SS type A sorting domain-containing protein [Pedobacter sp. BS3]
MKKIYASLHSTTTEPGITAVSGRKIKFMPPKLYFFCLLFLLAPGFANAQETVTIPDENFKNYLVANTDINKNEDEEIQVSEAEAFTGTIDCSGKGIADLTGIEAFVNITQLNCSINQLTNLNVTQNKALENLNCVNNQLTNLDITQNTALQVLLCDGNQLTNLNVSQNTALTELRCSSNQLINLDVSQNTALQILLCYNNELTKLNVKNGNNTILQHMQAQNNPNLSCIQVDDVAYANSGSRIYNWQKGTGDYNTDCYVTLPVTLVNFTAKTDGNHAKLQWQTASEQNNKGFEVYRSGDDDTFVKIGEVGSQTPSALQPSAFYTFTDKNPLNGTNYYKLVQIDNNGKTTELGIRQVTLNLTPSTLNLHPNPTTNQVTVNWDDASVSSIKLVDVSGKILQVIQPHLSATSITISLANYPAGTYVLRIEGNMDVEIRKIVKL